MKITNLSVFFPAYNEESNIAKTVNLAIKFLESEKINYEILVVNDGSSDQTAAVVSELTRKNKRISLISHPRNRGYGGALKTGMKESAFDWICYADSDGQFNFQELQYFLKFINQYDMVIGYRKKRSDSQIRHLLAKALQIGDWLLFGVWFKDIDCGFKLFKKKVVQTVFPLVTESAITESEFMIKAKRAGFKIKEVGVTHLAREKGIQTGAQLKVVSKAIREAFKLFWILNFRHDSR
jgi:glycosyltransferase involved in cell wall biosynthesis